MELSDEQTLAPATEEDDEFAPLSTELAEASSDAGSKGETGHSTVLQTAAMLTGEVMGTGVLSLPYACVALGWVLGIGASVLFAAAAAYAGVLLSRVRNGFFPQAASYADLAGATLRLAPTERLLTFCTADGAVVRLRAADAPTMGAWADAVEKLGTLACVERDSVLPTPVPVRE